MFAIDADARVIRAHPPQLTAHIHGAKRTCLPLVFTCIETGLNAVTRADGTGGSRSPIQRARPTNCKLIESGKALFGARILRYIPSNIALPSRA
jgi:hypothetical protein